MILRTAQAVYRYRHNPLRLPTIICSNWQPLGTFLRTHAAISGHTAYFVLQSGLIPLLQLTITSPPNETPPGGRPAQIGTNTTGCYPIRLNIAVEGEFSHGLPLNRWRNSLSRRRCWRC